MRSNKDDLKMYGFQEVQNVETRSIGQIHIQKNQVGFKGRYQFNSGFNRIGLAHHFDVLKIIAQKVGHCLSRKKLIVNNYGSHPIGFIWKIIAKYKYIRKIK
jgi:hypothetical protein